MKNTKQRDVILDIVNNSCNHLTAYQIYEESKKELPNISLGTVYRNLNLLVIQNKIVKIVIDGKSDRFDKLGSHIHFICTNCENIYDIYGFSSKKIKNIDGHLVMNCEIILKGICKKCQEKE
ncbi:MAG: transcriptional repressor [Bacilli bacterium]